MDQYEISGGRRLKGTLEVSGSKNAALPCLFATLLTDDPCELTHVPELADIDIAIRLLTTLGKKVERTGHRVKIRKDGRLTGRAPYELVRQMRASALVLGPLLARMGKARVSLPGGCAIGARPINYHLEGFEKMGTKIGIQHGYVEAKTKGLNGTIIKFPFASVGATENLMMAAVLAKGKTVIQNAAREPEIVDLGQMLRGMGASIRGLGTSKLIIQGVPTLGGVKHDIIPDRIELGTFIMAAAITKGDLLIKNGRLDLLPNVVGPLRKAGLKLVQKNGSVHAQWVRDLKPRSVATGVYPAFPTDLQAQWIALMSRVRGKSKVRETVFENRFLHVQELLRFGAQIQLQGQDALIEGVENLSGCTCMVSDLRAGAALVLAGLAAEGKSTILRIYHLDRGYEDLEGKLRRVGARITRMNPVKRIKKRKK